MSDSIWQVNEISTGHSQTPTGCHKTFNTPYFIHEFARFTIQLLKSNFMESPTRLILNECRNICVPGTIFSGQSPAVNERCSIYQSSNSFQFKFYWHSLRTLNESCFFTGTKMNGAEDAKFHVPTYEVVYLWYSNFPVGRILFSKSILRNLIKE